MKSTDVGQVLKKFKVDSLVTHRLNPIVQKCILYIFGKFEHITLTSCFEIFVQFLE